MVLEWLRRNSADFDRELKEYLFSNGRHRREGGGG